MNLDDMACFASLCRKAQAGTLSDADRNDLVTWAATHGEGIVASIAELERTLGEVHQVQRGYEERIRRLVASSRVLERDAVAVCRRLDQIESNIWGGPPPAKSGDRPRG